VLFIVFFFGFPRSALAEPGVEVAKSFKSQNGLEVTDVYPDNEFYVDILVRGYSQCNPAQQIPFDAVLAIDRSPSMLTKLDEAKAAARHFVDRARQASTNLSTGTIRIGLITFASDVDVIMNLSSNYTQVSNAIDQISQTYIQSTNMKDGLEKAQDMLYTSQNAQKIVVLLTDGCPSSEDQEPYIRGTLLPKALDAGIRYGTVGVGLNPCFQLLTDLATLTGGKYAHVAHASDITGAFDDIFDDVATCAVANRITLNESIDTSLVEVVPGFVQGSQGMPLPSPEDMQNFAGSGQITVRYGALRLYESRTFTFKLRTKACLTPLSSQDTVEIWPNQTTDITYWLGQVPTLISATQRSLVCHKPPHLCVRKSYSALDRQISITLKSMYPPTGGVQNAIKDIQVYEYTSSQYQYRHDITPDPPHRFIPGRTFDLLYWKIASLAPGEAKELRFGVDFIGSLPADSNRILLDAPDPKRVGVQVREGCHYGEISLGSVRYTAPGNVPSRVQLPQVRPDESVIETVPLGRPDLFITQAYDQNEFLSGVVETLPAAFIVENARPLPDNWAASLWARLWPGRDSDDIWVDSSTNGYVAAFRPRNDPAVISDIRAHLFHVLWDAPTGWFSGVQGQGDLFFRNEANRIYVRIENTAHRLNSQVSQGIVLEVWNFSTNQYVTIKTVDLPSVAAPGNTFVSLELPPGTLSDNFLRDIPGLAEAAGGQWNNIGIAELRVILNNSADEKHTSNNSATERIIVIR
jgi:hypothetical protein